MLAITTKFLGPTNHRGSRIKAIMPSGKSVTMGWDHSLDAIGNHRKAATEAVKKNLGRPIEFELFTGWAKNCGVHVVKYHFPEFEN